MNKAIRKVGRGAIVLVLILGVVFVWPLATNHGKQPVQSLDTSLLQHSDQVVGGDERKGGVELEDHRLELLMTYTVFHIGVYMSLVAAVIASLEYAPELFTKSALFVAIPLYLLAGACGGIIAVNIAEFDVNIYKVSAFYEGYGLSVLGIPRLHLEYQRVAAVEHRAFWVATLWLAGSFVWSKLKEHTGGARPQRRR